MQLAGIQRSYTRGVWVAMAIAGLILLAASPAAADKGRRRARSCTVTQGAGSATITCPDGSSATVFDGAAGADGAQGPQGTSGSAEARFQFVGFSEPGVSGGILGLNRACHAAFPSSRMCTTVEIMETVNPPMPAGDGWVRPVLQAATTADGGSAGGEVAVLDASGYSSNGGVSFPGLESADDLTCGAWREVDPGGPSPGTTGLGLLVDSNRSFFAIIA